jgi:hypothetical protein
MDISGLVNKKRGIVMKRINKLHLLSILLLILFIIPAAYYIVKQSQEDSKPVAQNTEKNSKESGEFVRYKDFGAAGDGVADDFDAIIRAHSYANSNNLKIKADDNATYYIGGANKTALILTDTDWRNAKFIIDDTNVVNRNSYIFNIKSKHSAKTITGFNTLKKFQEKMDIELDFDSLIVALDKNTIHFIREGLNQNNGDAQTDVFIVDKKGNVDRQTPVIWDYNNISSMTAYPIDTDTLTIKGGHFTTLANQESSQYNYYNRGINISRSNVVVDGLNHAVNSEGATGAPYNGFVTINNSANVMVKNSIFSGHKIYKTIGSANAPVSMGTYDITVGKSANVTFYNCKQINSIHDTTLWGIFASNYSKNITFDTVEFSRFDAHKGVTNATIKNSILGHQGINAIGGGVFLVENTKVCGTNLISLRSDYGSTWEGEMIIKNSEFLPRKGAQTDVTLISGSYSGMHNFGYTCYMPSKITFDGLTIIDTNTPANYGGPKIFGSFNNNYTSDDFKEKYPYVITDEIVINNMTIKSGKPFKISNNTYMFRNVKINANN